MKKTEKIIAIIAILAFTLKFSGIPGANILLIISFASLSILYFPFGVALFNGINLKDIFKKESYQGLSVLRIIGSFGVGNALSTLSYGIQFKLLHWPNGITYLVTGLILVIIALLFAGYKYFESKNNFYVSILIRLVAFVIIGFLAMYMFS